MAVGDIMLARSIGDSIRSQGPQVVFADVAEVLNSADVLVGNLECAITSTGQPEPKAYTFAAPPEAASALGTVGFGVLSLANNHALDYGPEGLFETQQLLSAQGIAGVGAGADEGAAHAPVVIEKNGLRIAFLAYVEVPVETGGFDTRVWIAGPEKPGVAWIDPARIQIEAAEARTQADVVVVLLHFGWEGRTTVYPEQRAAARAAIDGGAALVVGSHPHVLQTSEWYNGGFIAYSLGNFVFDGFGFPENYTAILSATLTPAGVADVQWIPAVLEHGLPRPATPDESAIILRMVGGG
jgi:poly-gamma-glutamate synthesis protein (capsule biosynthesis protein)